LQAKRINQSENISKSFRGATFYETPCRQAYRRRSACREANAEIIKSRQSCYQQRLNEATGNHAAQWRIVRELVHSDDDHAVMQPAEARRLCSQFNRFFIDKLQRIARESKYVTMY